MKYKIDYWDPKELPNKTLEFKVLDAKEVVVGYAVASAMDSFNLLGTDLNGFSENEDIKNLKNDLKRFCEVYYHTNSGNITES